MPLLCGNSMDDVYKVASKYANVSRKQFDELYDQAHEKLSAWKSGNCELDEDDLDMVVGGSVGSFFGSLVDAVSSATSAVGNFVKEHAGDIALAVCVGLMIGAVGAFGGLVVGAALGVAALGTLTVGSGVVAGVVGAGFALNKLSNE